MKQLKYLKIIPEVLYPDILLHDDNVRNRMVKALRKRKEEKERELHKSLK